MLASKEGGKGDNFVEHEVLRTPQGRRVGENSGSCLTVNAGGPPGPPLLVLCTFTMLLPHGQIVTQGLVPLKTYRREVLAITGGTGAYSGVRGQVTTVLDRNEAHTNTITVQLR